MKASLQNILDLLVQSSLEADKKNAIHDSVVAADLETVSKKYNSELRRKLKRERNTARYFGVTAGVIGIVSVVWSAYTHYSNQSDSDYIKTFNYSVAQKLANDRNYEGAIDRIERGLAADPNDFLGNELRSRYELFDRIERNDIRQEEITTLDDYIERNEDDYEARIRRSRVKELLRQYSDAITDCRYVLDRIGRDEISWYRVASLTACAANYILIGASTQADSTLLILGTLIESAPVGIAWKAEYNLLKGVLARRSSDYISSLRFLKEAVAAAHLSRNQWVLYRSLHQLAETSLKAQLYTDADSLLAEAAQIARNKNSQPLLLRSQQLRLLLLAERCRSFEAQVVARELFDIYAATINTDGQIETRIGLTMPTWQLSTTRMPLK